MRKLIISFFLFTTLAFGQASPISPTTPVANQGATVQFTDSDTGTWSCPGCAGSINSGTGLYTAPASVTNQQSAGGMQLLPNNHIFNVRVDSLPVCSGVSTGCAGVSATLLNSSNAGTKGLNYLGSFPLNYANGSTPTVNILFYYTPSNNAAFQIPAYPAAKIENGWINATRWVPGMVEYCEMGADHHLLVMDTTDGTMQEMYQYYPPGCNGDLSTTNSQSGLRYSNSSYLLPPNGAGQGTTDAAGLQLWPLTLRLQEVEQAIAASGTIKHALRFTLNNGFVAPNTYIWPATTPNSSYSGLNLFGERVRLKASYNISGFSSIAQILLTQQKQYGMVIADGGTGWQPTIEDTRWPLSIALAFNEIQNANIAPSNYEVVDESSLIISSASGEANTGREKVIFTRTSDSATATVDIVLRGVAVNLPQDIYNIQAGTSAQQLTAYVNIGSVTWSMSPSVGSLTSGGLYTPPATSSSIQATTVTATSSTNGAVAAQMSLRVFPQTSMYIKTCATGSAPCTNYTDSNGKAWLAGEYGGGDANRDYGTLEQFYSYDNGGSWSGTDIVLYELPIHSGNDIRYDFVVPNGTYQVDLKVANNFQGAFGVVILPELNGVQYNSGNALKIYDLAGGNNQPYDVTMNTTVSDNHLSCVIRAAYITGGTTEGPWVSALSIIQTGSGGGGGQGVHTGMLP